MGQKVHPFGFRLGIFEDWKARWFAKRSYGKELMEDFRIREYLNNRFDRSDISNTTIEKAVDNVRIIIQTAKPGVIIGKKGQEIEQIKVDLASKIKKNIDISVQEVKNVDIEAKLVATGIAEQLEKRSNYKRLMKRAGYAAMKNGAKGIKICIAGRLGGAEIARTEWLRLGSIPLHTLRFFVNFALVEAETTYGVIGVKVWICRGKY